MPRVILVLYAVSMSFLSYLITKGMTEDTAIRLLNSWGLFSILWMLLHIYDVIKEKK